MSQEKFRIVVGTHEIFNITDPKKKPSLFDSGHTVALLSTPFVVNKVILSDDPDGVNLNLTLTDEA